MNVSSCLKYFSILIFILQISGSALLAPNTKRPSDWAAPLNLKGADQTLE